MARSDDSSCQDNPLYCAIDVTGVSPQAPVGPNEGLVEDVMPGPATRVPPAAIRRPSPAGRQGPACATRWPGGTGLRRIRKDQNPAGERTWQAGAPLRDGAPFRV